MLRPWIQRSACVSSSSLAPLRFGRFLSSTGLCINPEVKAALDENRPVVALESTIISHGMPFPRNLECAKQVEQVVRDNGATPATIAILDGQVHIGLTTIHLERLARLGTDCRKTSRRDLAWVVSSRQNGATTVAATMHLAHRAGIDVFSTGGIGGVHRGVEETWDISADLTELSRTGVCVVCAGIKSILDIPRTLEYLETMGVPVMSYQQRELPAFFSSNSGIMAPFTIHTAGDVARIIQAHKLLGLTNGQVVAVPTPQHHEAEEWIQMALEEARKQNITGAAMTPFLLQRVHNLSGGQSIDANIALVCHNSQVASQIAVELSLSSRGSKASLSYALTPPPASSLSVAAQPSYTSPSPPSSNPCSSFSSSLEPVSEKPTSTLENAPLIIGGTNLDVIGRPSRKFKLGERTSTEGIVTSRWGGVGRNIAEAAARMGRTPLFLTIVGKDMNGDAFLRSCQRLGILVNAVIRDDICATSEWLAILDQTGDLSVAIADTGAAELVNTKQALTWLKSTTPIVVLDANLTTQTITGIAMAASHLNVPVWAETISTGKCSRILPAWRAGHVNFISTSCVTFQSLIEKLQSEETKESTQKAGEGAPYTCQGVDTEETQEEREQRQIQDMLQSIHQVGGMGAYVILTRGARGVLVGYRPPDIHTMSSQAQPQAQIELWSLPARPLPDNVAIHTTGAGDTLVGVTLAALIQTGKTACPAGGVPSFSVPQVLASIQTGMTGSYLSLQSDYSVSPHLSPESISQLGLYGYPSKARPCHFDIG
eukprot:gb/GEZN01001865.1/.p1 GENE.gb/GEZN01001865.1/~~gb/GEZN01001865.1/.p1  ORF type:complete len:771 (+),score=88.24 gb/GEZN01001865.1/:59-2371(+)